MSLLQDRFSVQERIDLMNQTAKLMPKVVAKYKTPQSGVQGICWNKTRGDWGVFTTYNGTRIFCGYVADDDDYKNKGLAMQERKRIELRLNAI